MKNVIREGANEAEAITSRRSYADVLTDAQVARFWGRVVMGTPTACWSWRGEHSPKGYAYFSVTVDGREHRALAHRVMWELQRARIADDFQIDHVCRVRGCVNPAHLEPVTARENTLRGVGITADQARRTHCINGHPFSGENLAKWSCGKRERVCLTCHRSRARQRMRRMRAEASHV